MSGKTNKRLRRIANSANSPTGNFPKVLRDLYKKVPKNKRWQLLKDLEGSKK
jgi:hypothetical protein